MALRILILGAQGKLGSRIVFFAEKSPELFSISGQVGSPSSPLGSDIRPFLLSSDIVLDVSTPNALTGNLPLIVAAGLPLVIGSTGHSSEQKKAIQEASHTLPILLTSNFSFGIHTLKNLLSHLPEGRYAVEETHHTEKKDAPSGTALDLLSLLPEGTRITSIREGGEIGQHKITLSLPYEELEIRHTALSRDVFALGALKASSFLYHKPKGLYNTFYG